MRIKDLPGWPPECFYSAADPKVGFVPEDASKLLIDSVTLILGSKRTSSVLHVILVDKAGGVPCSARFPIAGNELAQGAYSALKACMGLTFAKAGFRKLESA